VSVHATDPQLRHVLLGKPKTIRGDLMERLARLAAGGIRIHAQSVLCPGLNDGAQLERTVRELSALHPAVATVTVVPVGLTRHRDGLPALRSITADEARATVAAIHAWQRDHLRRAGSRIVFAADELYLQGGLAIPAAAEYEGFPVAEDGIGLVRRFEDAFLRAVRRRRGQAPRVGAVTVVTGELFAPILRRLLDGAALAAPAIDVVPARNDFFGPAITVAGLLTGQDIARALAARALGDLVLVPGVALHEGHGVFLDDVTPPQLADSLGVPVEAPEASAEGLLGAVLGRRAVRSA
jgi:putative radical SAM enzyme (TIGR03279 family)